MGVTEANPSDNKFDSADYYYTHKGRRIGVEIKTRA